MAFIPKNVHLPSSHREIGDGIVVRNVHLPSSHREIRDGIVVRSQNFWISENFVTKSVEASQGDADVRRRDPVLELRTEIINKTCFKTGVPTKQVLMVLISV